MYTYEYEFVHIYTYQINTKDLYMVMDKSNGQLTPKPCRILLDEIKWTSMAEVHYVHKGKKPTVSRASGLLRDIIVS